MTPNERQADLFITTLQQYRETWQRYALDVMDGLPAEANEELDRAERLYGELARQARALAR